MIENLNPYSPAETRSLLRAFDQREHDDTGLHLRVLASRLAYLDEKIATGNASKGAMDYARGETAALRWAIDKLKDTLAKEREAQQCQPAS